MAADNTDSVTRLVNALILAGAPPAMIQAARDGYYNDYLSPLAMPISQLIHDSRINGLGPAFLVRITAGEFDGTREEADAWAASPEGRETFKEFGLEPEKPGTTEG